MRFTPRRSPEHHIRMADHKAEFYAAAGGSPHRWIQGAIKHPGSLRKSLGVSKGEKIPAAKLREAAHSRNPLTAKRANLALTLAKLPRHHGPRKG